MEISGGVHSSVFGFGRFLFGLKENSKGCAGNIFTRLELWWVMLLLGRLGSYLIWVFLLPTISC